MGTWRIMPLLSTLAALVIIVHSAEEDLGRDLERDYGYDLRPRLLNTGIPSNDEPWRRLEERDAIQPSTQKDDWQNSPEEPQKRRRSLRKRKRRPIISEEPIPEEKPLSIETPEEIHVYPKSTDTKDIEEPVRYSEVEVAPRYRSTEYLDATTVAVRRRRKRPDRRNRWAEEHLDVERPARRRGLKRKRPNMDPERMTEFNQHKQEETEGNYRQYIETEGNYRTDMEIEGNYEREERINKQNPDEIIAATVAEPEETTTEATTKTVIENQQNVEPIPLNLQLKEDRSLSEFSLEIPIRNDRKRLPKAKKIQKSRNYEQAQEQKQDNRPIDPLTLKEILKRSNGASLSEILQQHNLSLSDLLRGKEDAISALKFGETIEKDAENTLPEKSEEAPSQETNIREDVEQQAAQTVSETNIEIKEPIPNTETSTDKVNDLEYQSSGSDTSQPKEDVKENLPKIASKRRIPNARRKLRMRPAMNSTYKSQLNRDLMAVTARKYQNNRNNTKSKEWKNVISMMNTSNIVEETNNTEIVDAPTTTSTPEEITTLQNTQYYNPTTISITTQTDTNDNESDEDNINEETTQTSMSTTEEITTIDDVSTTEASKILRLKPAPNRMGLRRQAFNNRLKRKRLRQKNSTTESPAEKFMVDLFGMPNLVSSSEFIARTQSPKTTIADNQDIDFTTLEDFMTTEKTRHAENGPRFTRNSTIPYLENDLRATTPKFSSTTEETAKFEIEEILNDTRTSARLSRILMERNMTLNELLEHRERGSSHVHLADIFHNASKEPNPPEPFLSKSSIEPISKETYPLRAILEANLHESTAKATTIDPNPLEAHFLHIPVVMDFGNNVNENGENMGIMSLFNKFTENEISNAEKSIGKDSEGTPYVTTVIAVNNTNSEDTQRKGRDFKADEDNLKHDIVGWNELFELMRKANQNETDEEANPNEGSTVTKPNKKVVLQDSDGDGLIVLEDLKRLKELGDGNNLASEEKLQINSYERTEVPIQPGILDRAPSNTRSVTVATASIIGLAMILFLLTYAAFKWKQQRSLLRKKQSFNDEKIPTPVFENRKGHKNNCSTRSISPMLNSSNIYTMNTLDSNTGKESPDYMWDSLRKPFQ